MRIKTMKYAELKNQTQKRFNNIPGMFFAFSNEQFNEGIKKVGLNEDDTDQLVRLGGGGYIKKDCKQIMLDAMEQNEKELADFLATEEGLIDALVYELNNHEYSYTGEIDDALDALGLEVKDIPKDILRSALELAYKE